MKIEYVCHACVLIDTGDIKIATDPWYESPAYCGQWNVFPKPVNSDTLQAADVILISHGHEDHLHEATLRTMPQSARVFYPFNWYGGTREYIQGMGFSDVREAETFKTYRLTPRTSVTFIACGLDSIVVIESDGQVLVNVNDALHSMTEQIIDFYVKQILQRWPVIDTVLCGFGGASYFPNTIHAEGKDDIAIGELREQLFAHNFCRIISGLRPRVAVPFAADFALLDPHNRWINDVRFPRSLMGQYFEEQFGADAAGITVQDMYSGDVLDNGKLLPLSPYRSEFVNGDLNHLIDSQYAGEIAALGERPVISETAAEDLRTQMLANIRLRMTAYEANALDRLKFSVIVTDVSRDNCYNVSFSGGEPQVRRGSTPDAATPIHVETTSPILLTSFGSEWGGDAITIGYGCQIHIHDTSVLESQLDLMAVSLLTRHPSESKHLRKEPLRALRHMSRSPLLRSWLSNKLRGKPETYYAYDRVIWLMRDKCEVCRICDLPLLDSRFAAGL